MAELDNKTLDGKTALVTGAAGGIGSATAYLFAGQGASVMVADLDLSAAQVVADSICERGSTAIAAQFDLGDDQSIDRLFTATADAFGGVDVIVNNASATHLAAHRDTPIETADIEVWDETFRINVRGTMLCTKFATAQMSERGGGSIINIASNAGMTGDVGHPAYGASKAAVVRMTTYTALEFGQRGIRCNAISPGLIVTPATSQNWAAGPMREIMQRQHLTGRLGAPADIANAALFLASDKSSFITGQVIHVDGGMLSHSPYAADVMDLVAANQ